MPNNTMTSFEDIFSIPQDLNINWKPVISVLLVLQYIFETYLEHRQYKELKSALYFNNPIHKEKTQDHEYEIAKLKFDVFEKTGYLFRGLITIKFELLFKIWLLSGYIMTSFSSFLPEKAIGNVITQSVIFINIIQIISTIFGLPFNYYEQFILQEKYGFNEQTIGQFIGKTIMRLPMLLVGGSISIVVYLTFLERHVVNFLLSIMCFNAVVNLAGNTVFLTSFLMSFVKFFKPLEDGDLKTAIEDLASQEQFPLSKLHVYIVNDSRMGPEFLSQYSTVYFIGMPWNKQVVLYDTLIDCYTKREILAVFAYEMGHSKHSHSIKAFLLLRTYLLLLIWLYTSLIHNKSFYNTFGFITEQPSVVGLFLLIDILLLVESFLGFIRNLVSRRGIFEADKYASGCGYAKDLGTLLLKSLKEKEDLTTKDIDYLYSTWHNSEPILSERLSLLNSYQSEERPEKVE